MDVALEDVLDDDDVAEHNLLPALPSPVRTAAACRTRPAHQGHLTLLHY